MRLFSRIALAVVLASPCALVWGCPPGGGDGDGDADSDADSDDGADGDVETDADGEGGPAGDADGDFDTDADVSPDGDADADAESDGDADGDADADIEPDGDADSDADGPLDADLDGGSDGDADGDDDETSWISPVTGSVTTGCRGDEDVGDLYAFEAGAGETIVARVDTLAALTASDLWAMLFYDLSDIGLSVVAEGDDELDCTFPPPRYACPELTWVVGPRHSGTFYLFVGPLECVDPTNAEYQLSVMVDGDPMELTLVEDEYVLE